MPDLFNTTCAEFSSDRKQRYFLSRIWDDRKPLLLFIGFNPSIADEYIDDHTITRCIGFTNRFGYGGFYIVNLFSWMSTDPKQIDLLLFSQPKEVIDHEKEINNLYIQETAKKCDKIIFAWGTLGARYPKRCEEIKQLFPERYCLRKTKEGHPEHPLMLPKNLQLIKYE